MRRRSVWTVVVLLLFILPTLIFFSNIPAEYVEASIMKKITPPGDEAMVQRWVQWLREGNFDQIERRLDPSLRTDDLRDKLQGMAVLIPAQAAKSVKTIGHVVAYHPDSSRTVTTTLEYEFPNQWLLAMLAVQQQSAGSSVTGFRVYRLRESVEAHNRLTLVGKDPVHYGVLLLAVAALAISVYGVIVSIRAPVGKKRWLWAIVCLVGVGRLAINWTTGAVGFTPIWVGFPPSGAAMVPLYSPWMVYTSLPIGATLFLILRDRLARLERMPPGSLEGVLSSPPDGAASPMTPR